MNGRPSRTFIVITAVMTVVLVIGIIWILFLTTSRTIIDPGYDQFRLTDEYLNPTIIVQAQLTQTQSFFDVQTLTRAALIPTLRVSNIDAISTAQAAGEITIIPSRTPTPGASTTPVSTAIIAEMTATGIAQLTVAAMPPTVAPCYFNWATEDLPDLTAEIQSAMDDAGLQNVTVSASAYGENCYAYDTDEVLYFAEMETDFHVTAQVDDLEDTEALGSLTADILAVLNQFPPDATPGPMPGQISITFTKDEEQLFLPVTVEQAADGVARGLSGAELWDALNEPG